MLEGWNHSVHQDRIVQYSLAACNIIVWLSSIAARTEPWTYYIIWMFSFTSFISSVIWFSWWKPVLRNELPLTFLRLQQVFWKRVFKADQVCPVSGRVYQSLRPLLLSFVAFITLRVMLINWVIGYGAFEAWLSCLMSSIPFNNLARGSEIVNCVFSHSDFFLLCCQVLFCYS